jgi:hypothetical protein
MKEDEGKRDYLFCLSIGYTRLKVSLFVYRCCNGHDCMVAGFAHNVVSSTFFGV